MARADLLVALITAGTINDRAAFERAAEAIIAEETEKRHSTFAQNLTRALKSKGPLATNHFRPAILRDRSDDDALVTIEPIRKLTDLVLPDIVHDTCQEISEEHHRRDLLRSFGIEPRHKILLVGPPGSGKTSLAEAIASSLMVPMLTARYESLIGSYLGETVGRLSRLFEKVRLQSCVLFFDEFEAVAKERHDPHESGEIKRLVSSLLLEFDRLPSHVTLIAATNHDDMLDRAVWRRMDVRLTLPAASRKGMETWLMEWESRTGLAFEVPHRTIADHFIGRSYAELEQYAQDVQRRYILAGPSASVSTISRSRLKRWTRSKQAPND